MCAVTARRLVARRRHQYRDQAADLAAIAEQLGLARFSLIGTSMGGIIAMNLTPGSIPSDWRA